MQRKITASHLNKRSKKIEKFQNLLDSYLDYWIPVLGLDSWSRITSYFNIETRPSSGTLGDAAVNWQYTEADITIYLAEIVDGDFPEDRLEYVVVHELCHCLVNEMRDENSDEKHLNKYLIPHEERVVSNLAMAFLRLKYGKKAKK